MINAKMIARIMGALFFIEAGFLILCSFLAVYYNESDISAFLYSAAITAGAGSIAALAGKNAEKRISRRDGYVIVTLAWVFFSLFGMLPFYLSGYIPTITDAFFETMSGFTTTGASILDNIESLPHGLLFWRSMTQWIGGLGIVFFTIAVLPIFGVGSVQLFAAEATGPTHDKVHPRIGVTAKWIWTIYLGSKIQNSTGIWELWDFLPFSLPSLLFSPVRSVLKNLSVKPYFRLFPYKPLPDSFLQII